MVIPCKIRKNSGNDTIHIDFFVEFPLRETIIHVECRFSGIGRNAPLKGSMRYFPLFLACFGKIFALHFIATIRILSDSTITTIKEGEIMITRRSPILVLAMALLVAAAIPFSLPAQTGDTAPAPLRICPNFVDLNGDGYCDNAPDDDNDGIPNCQDPDWTCPQDGTGAQNGNQYKGTNGPESGNGLGNGTCTCSQLRDGSCTDCGSGVCDGTGPKGQAKGRK
jgi:hypothetical protein